MSRMFGDRRGNQARATARGAASSRAATAESAADCSGLKPPGGKKDGPRSLSPRPASPPLILGVPLSAAMGNAAGCRVAFASLAALSAVGLALIVIILPDVRPQASEHHAAPGRRRQMTAVIGSNTLALLGHNMPYTYVSVLLCARGRLPAPSVRYCWYSASPG